MKKLIRQIRREAARSPQKAAVLGLLALVAVWFWAPLVLDWVRGDDQKKTAAAAEADPLAMEFAVSGIPAAVAPTQQTQPKGPALPGDWREVIAGLESDPWTKAAGAVAPKRDPFVAIDFPPLHQSLVQNAEDKDDEKAKKPPELSPKDVGLALTSTLVGPRGGLALIGGKAYRPQDKIVATHQSQPIEFTLAEVHPRRAVLLREGKSYNLNIPRPDGSDPGGQDSGQ